MPPSWMVTHGHGGRAGGGTVSASTPRPAGPNAAQAVASAGRRWHMTPRYYAVPSARSYGPSKTFTKPLEALQYARTAAQQFHLAYAVWEPRGVRFRLLKA